MKILTSEKKIKGKIVVLINIHKAAKTYSLGTASLEVIKYKKVFFFN